jgi:hypothetical protein
MLDETQEPTTTAQNGGNSYIHYAAYTVLSIALLVSLYFNFMPQKKQQNFEVANNQTQISFMDLPLNERTQYVKANEYDELQNRFDTELEQKASMMKEFTALQEELAQITKKQQNQVTTTSNETTQDKTQTASASIQKQATNNNQAANEYVQDSHDIVKKDATIVGFTSCYDMNIGQYNITKTCKKSIQNFVSKHKNAAYFEIIGIVDETEFVLYKNLQTNDFIYDKLGINQQSVDVMKKLSQSGLAKHRAIEANWVIKSYTNMKAKAYNANYHLHSNTHQRGVVIRAYQ